MALDLQSVDFNDPATWPNWFKLTGAVLIGIGILFAGYWFLVKKDIEGLKRVEAEEQTLRASYLKKKSLAINLPAYREQMVEIEKNFGVLLRQLPDRTEVPELLIDITQAGLARGLQFQLFKPKPKQVGDFYATLPIDLKVTGPYHLLAEFVSDLAAMPRIVTLGNINIKPVKEGSTQLSMSAVSRTFHYLDDDEIAEQADANQKVRSGG